MRTVLGIAWIATGICVMWRLALWDWRNQKAKRIRAAMRAVTRSADSAVGSFQKLELAIQEAMKAYERLAEEVV